MTKSASSIVTNNLFIRYNIRANNCESNTVDVEKKYGSHGVDTKRMLQQLYVCRDKLIEHPLR